MGHESWTDIVGNRDAQFEAHLFPLSVIGQGGWLELSRASIIILFWSYFETRIDRLLPASLHEIGCVSRGFFCILAMMLHRSL